MKKHMTVLLLCTAMVISVTGCGTSTGEVEQEYFSRVNYTYNIPCKEGESNEFHISAPFYKVYMGDDRYSDILGNDTLEYKIGIDVNLIGKNTEKIEGGSVDVAQFKLSDLVDKGAYVNELTRLEHTVYGIWNEENAFDTEKIRSIVNGFYSDTYVMSFTMSCEGQIDDDIEISKMEIKELGLEYSFDNFKLCSYKVPKDVILEPSLDDDEMPISHNVGFDGMITCTELSGPYSCFMEGTANEDISKLTVQSILDGCEVINEDNYKKYEEYSKEYVGLYKEQKEENYKKGEKIDLSYDYIFDKEETEGYDAVMANLLLKIETAAGREVWCFGEQLSIVTGEYLLFPMVHEELT